MIWRIFDLAECAQGKREGLNRPRLPEAPTPEKVEPLQATRRTSPPEVRHRVVGFLAIEFATLTWVGWFNNRRLREPNGNIPPAEAKVRYQAILDETARAT